MKQTTPVLSFLMALLLGLGLPSAIQAQGEATPPATADPNVVPFAGPGEGLEAAVSGLDYRLGPGDGLVVAIWGPQPQVFEVKVNLEGSVLIPTVGTVDVRGDLLGEAKKKITSRVNRSYRGVTVTVTLTELRRFQVHVLGQVRRAGTYLATAVDRVSAAIGWSGGLGADSGARRIQVKNQGEVRTQADLPRFFRDGDMASNPLLQDGDVIVVPFVGKQFSILGAVNAPGSYQFLPEDRLSDALELVGGFRTDAQAETLEVVRYPEGQEEPLRFFLTGSGELFAAEAGWSQGLPEPESYFQPVLSGLEVAENIQYPDIKLQADDVIFVRSIPVERKRRFVDVRGEVAFPGTYAITEGETHISDVIEMAGGFTDEAFLGEARLTRREAIRTEDREFERLKTIPAADMSEDEYEYFKVKSRERPGLMVVNFIDLFVEGDTNEDILVTRGDLIEIPSRRDFVSVLGLVEFPGNVLHQPNLSPRDYIDAAGGFAEDADKSKARVIRALGGEWVSINDAKTLYEGDTVWIPEKQDRDYWGIFKDILVVTTQILTIYLIVDRATATD